MGHQDRTCSFLLLEPAQGGAVPFNMRAATCFAKGAHAGQSSMT